jgi:hypothetical protein
MKKLGLVETKKMQPTNGVPIIPTFHGLESIQVGYDIFFKLISSEQDITRNMNEQETLNAIVTQRNTILRLFDSSLTSVFLRQSDVMAQLFMRTGNGVVPLPSKSTQIILYKPLSSQCQKSQTTHAKRVSEDAEATWGEANVVIALKLVLI